MESNLILKTTDYHHVTKPFVPDPLLLRLSKQGMYLRCTTKSYSIVVTKLCRNHIITDDDDSRTTDSQSIYTPVHMFVTSLWSVLAT